MPENSVEFATLNSKVDSLAASIEKLAGVVEADRGAHARSAERDREAAAETTRGIYNDLTSLRDRQASSGRITWPLVVTTFSAAIGFAAIVAGLGSYALQSETGKLNARMDSVQGSTSTLVTKQEHDRDADILTATRLAKSEEWRRLLEPYLLPPVPTRAN